MSQYRHKPTLVEAYKFMGHQALEAMPSEFMACVVMAPSPKLGTLYFINNRPLRVGDWLVKDDVEIFRVPDSVFKKQFEVL